MENMQVPTGGEEQVSEVVSYLRRHVSFVAKIL